MLFQLLLVPRDSGTEDEVQGLAKACPMLPTGRSPLIVGSKVQELRTDGFTSLGALCRWLFPTVHVANGDVPLSSTVRSQTPWSWIFKPPSSTHLQASSCQHLFWSSLSEVWCLCCILCSKLSPLKWRSSCKEDKRNHLEMFGGNPKEVHDQGSGASAVGDNMITIHVKVSKTGIQEPEARPQKSGSLSQRASVRQTYHASVEWSKILNSNM